MPATTRIALVGLALICALSLMAHRSFAATPQVVAIAPVDQALV